MKHKITYGRPIDLFTLRGSRVYNYTLFNKKEMSMLSNRIFIVTLASAGFAAQLFVLICNNALSPAYGNTFNAIGALALFISFVAFVLGQRSEERIRAERDQVYRDIDQVYRYIDDTAREIRDDMYARERETTCSSTACRAKR